jgi:two-component system KDP operon response regulator KdpE
MEDRACQPSKVENTGRPNGIRANLRRAPPHPKEGPEEIAFAGIEVNLASRQVMVNGRKIHLRPKEFDVFCFLVANPNVVVPHGKIIRAVWGPDYGDEVEYLHVIINQIRRKIEPEPKRPRYILTEPRIGYRFRVPAGNAESYEILRALQGHSCAVRNRSEKDKP